MGGSFFGASRIRAPSLMPGLSFRLGVSLGFSPVPFAVGDPQTRCRVPRMGEISAGGSLILCNKQIKLMKMIWRMIK